MRQPALAPATCQASCFVSTDFCLQQLAQPIMVKTSQTRYDGNQSDHHLSEKYSADAFFHTSNATKFKAIVIASPTNPIILNDFIFLRVRMSKFSHSHRRLGSDCNLDFQISWFNSKLRGHCLLAPTRVRPIISADHILMPKGPASYKSTKSTPAITNKPMLRRPNASVLESP